MSNQRRAFLKAGSLVGAGMVALPLIVRAQPLLSVQGAMPPMAGKRVGVLQSRMPAHAGRMRTLQGFLAAARLQLLSGGRDVDFVLSLPQFLAAAELDYVVGCVDDALLPLCADAARHSRARWLWDAQMIADSAKESQWSADEQKLVRFLLQLDSSDKRRGKTAEWFLLAV